MMAALIADIAKNTAVAFPPIRRLQEARRRAATRSDLANTPQYSRGVYERHGKAIEKYRSLSGSLLEIGPGGNVGVAALFAKNGIDSAVCIDIVRWETVAPDFYEELGVVEALHRVEYLAPVAIEDTPFACDSFDAIISHSCFEHFRDQLRRSARLPGC